MMSWWREHVRPTDAFAALAVTLLAIMAVGAWFGQSAVGDGTRSAVVTAALGGVSTVVAYYLGDRKAATALQRADAAVAVRDEIRSDLAAALGKIRWDVDAVREEAETIDARSDRDAKA